MIILPTKFENFTDKLMEAPLVRIAIFSAICGIACISIKEMSCILFGIAAIAIITRLFSAWIFQFIKHILMKISMVSLWIGAQLSVVSCVTSIIFSQNEDAANGSLLSDLSKLLSIFSNQGITSVNFGGVVFLVITIATSIAITVFVITLLMRIFVAMFL